MTDPRLNSVHLEAPRRQEYRRARDVLLEARGSHTILVSANPDSFNANRTLIENNQGAAERDLACWLSEGEFLCPLHIGVNTLGRASDNDVVLEDSYSSRRHCAILVHSSGTFELHDTASKNGTYLNGVRLSAPALLKCGDEIRISERTFLFHTRGSEMDVVSHQATPSR
jgi:FHA domain